MGIKIHKNFEIVFITSLIIWYYLLMTKQAKILETDFHKWMEAYDKNHGSTILSVFHHIFVFE